MVTVRPTPIGKSDGYGDRIHCRAEIRDDKEKKGKHLPRYSSEAEFLKLDGHIFLYKAGKWHYQYKDELSTYLPQKLTTYSAKPLEGLEFYQLDAKGEMSYLYSRDLKDWESIITKSNEEQSAIFVFRNNKIVTTINHPLDR